MLVDLGDDNEAIKLFADVIGLVFIGLLHIGEACVAAAFWQPDAVKGRKVRRFFLMSMIRMPIPRAYGDEAAICPSFNFTAI